MSWLPAKLILISTPGWFFSKSSASLVKLSVSEAAARTVMVLLELAVAEELPAAFEPDEFVLLDPPQPDRPSTAADAVAAVAVVRERFILVAFCLSVG